MRGDKRDLELISVLGRLGRKAVLAASYLDADITPLPVRGDKRAEEKLKQVLETASKGARRDMRRYRLARYALGYEMPMWLKLDLFRRAGLAR